MDLTSISTLMTGTLSDFGDQVLIVLTATIGVAIAYFLFKFAWRAITRSVSGGTPTGSYKTDLNMYHYGNNYMKAKGINPMGYGKFKE